MTLVVTVAQQKGGAGKTMLVAMLAAAATGQGRVAVIDCDPQGSLTRWIGLREARADAPPIILRTVSGWRLTNELTALRRGHDLILIDSPPQVDTDARQTVRAADLVLVPVQPSPPDLWAAEGTLKLAAEERRRIALVLNRAPANSRLRTLMEKEIRDRGLDLLGAWFGNRAGYANAFAVGRGVTEASPKSVAAEEVRAVLSALQPERVAA
jgi:chromosome partitioning protein